MPKEISRKIGILNIVYTIAIVFYHFNLESLVTGKIVCDSFVEKVVFFFNRWMTNAGTYAVSFFYMTSAFLLYYNLSKDNWIEKIKRRIFSLCIPYLLWNFIYMCLFNHTRLLEGNFLLAIRGFANSEYCGPLWFVEGLVFMLLFLPIIYYVMKIPVLGEIVVVSSFIANFMGWSFVKGNGFVDLMGIFRYLYYVPSYMLGVYIAIRLKHFVWKLEYSKWVRVIAGVGFLTPFLLQNYPKCNMFFSLIHPVFLWILLPVTCGKSKLKYIGSPFMIYAMHDAGYQSFRRIFSFFNWAWYSRSDWSSVSILYLWGYRVLMGSVVLFLCIFFAEICRRCLPKIYFLLSGGRGVK